MNKTMMYVLVAVLVGAGLLILNNKAEAADTTQAAQTQQTSCGTTECACPAGCTCTKCKDKQKHQHPKGCTCDTCKAEAAKEQHAQTPTTTTATK